MINVLKNERECLVCESSPHQLLRAWPVPSRKRERKSSLTSVSVCLYVFLSLSPSHSLPRSLVFKLWRRSTQNVNYRRIVNKTRNTVIEWHRQFHTIQWHYRKLIESYFMATNPFLSEISIETPFFMRRDEKYVLNHTSVFNHQHFLSENNLLLEQNAVPQLKGDHIGRKCDRIDY